MESLLQKSALEVVMETWKCTHPHLANTAPGWTIVEGFRDRASGVGGVMAGVSLGAVERLSVGAATTKTHIGFLTLFFCLSNPHTIFWPEFLTISIHQLHIVLSSTINSLWIHYWNCFSPGNLLFFFITRLLNFVTEWKVLLVSCKSSI